MMERFCNWHQPTVEIENFKNPPSSRIVAQYFSFFLHEEYFWLLHLSFPPSVAQWATLYRPEFRPPWLDCESHVMTDWTSLSVANFVANFERWLTCSKMDRTLNILHASLNSIHFKQIASASLSRWRGCLCMQISLVLDTRASLLLDGWVGGSELHLLWKLKLEMDACTCADWLACACSTPATSYRVRVCPMLLSVTVIGGVNQCFFIPGAHSFATVCWRRPVCFSSQKISSGWFHSSRACVKKPTFGSSTILYI